MRSKGPFNRQIAIQGNTFRAPIRKAGLASRQNQGPPPSLPRPATTQWGRRTTVSSQPTPEGLALDPVCRLVTSLVIFGTVQRPCLGQDLQPQAYRGRAGRVID